MITEKDKNYYPLLWQCILSGQVTDRQIQEHLKDNNFKEWLKKERKKI